MAFLGFLTPRLTLFFRWHAAKRCTHVRQELFSWRPEASWLSISSPLRLPFGKKRIFLGLRPTTALPAWQGQHEPLWAYSPGSEPRLPSASQETRSLASSVLWAPSPGPSDQTWPREISPRTWMYCWNQIPGLHPDFQSILLDCCSGPRAWGRRASRWPFSPPRLL